MPDMVMPVTTIDRIDGQLSGERVNKSTRRLKDLPDIFADREAYCLADPEQVVYEVVMHDACGVTEGGLFFGTSFLSPGKVGSEYFMTKGHYHEKRNRGEYYWGIQGQGMLVLMDEQQNANTKEVFPGSLHYIPGHMAHRLVNTGDDTLIVGACWPSDAGHDYEAIARCGFPIRICERDGRPVVISIRDSLFARLDK